MEEPMVVVSAAVPVELRDELARRAAEGDRTVSQEVRRILRRELAHREPHARRSSETEAVAS